MPIFNGDIKGSENVLGELASLATSVHNEFMFVDPLVSGTVSASKNRSPLIIGFTPPEITVNYIPWVQDRDVREGIEADLIPIGAAQGQGGAKVDTVALLKSYPDSFYAGLKDTAKRLNMNPEDLVTVLLCESGMNPSAHPPKPNEAYGLNQLTRGAAKDMGMTDAEYEVYKGLSAEAQIPYVERYFRRVAPNAKYPNATAIYLANFAPKYRILANQPDTILYDGRGPRNAQGKPLQKGEPGYDPVLRQNQQAYDANKGLDTSKKGFINVQDMTNYVDRTKNSPGYRTAIERLRGAPDRYAPSTVDVNTGSGKKFAINVMGGGVANAASKDGLQFMGRELSGADAYRRLASALLVERINRQIKIMRETPGLIMLVNPSNVVTRYEQSIDTATGRRGQILSQWLEKPVKITASGISSAFYSVKSESDGGGLTNKNRITTLGYLNLMSMVSIYLNNGVIFNDDNINHSLPVFAVGLYIYYDGILYLGSFDQLSITDTGEKPFTLSYSFTFNVRYKQKLGDMI